jgi:hypothetical protein
MAMVVIVTVILCNRILIREAKRKLEPLGFIKL